MESAVIVLFLPFSGWEQLLLFQLPVRIRSVILSNSFMSSWSYTRARSGTAKPKTPSRVLMETWIREMRSLPVFTVS